MTGTVSRGASEQALAGLGFGGQPRGPPLRRQRETEPPLHEAQGSLPPARGGAARYAVTRGRDDGSASAQLAARQHVRIL